MYHTLTVIRIFLTVLKTAVAGTMVGTFSTTSKAAIATLNEVIVFSLRLRRLIVENMESKRWKAALEPVGSEEDSSNAMSVAHQPNGKGRNLTRMYSPLQNNIVVMFSKKNRTRYFWFIP